MRDAQPERELASAVLCLAIKDARAGSCDAKKFLYSQKPEWKEIRHFWCEVLDISEDIFLHLKKS